MVMNMFNVSVFSANVFRDIRSGNPGCIWNLSILQSFKELEYAHRQWNEDAKMSFPYRIIPCAVGDNLDTNFTSEAEHHIYRGFWSEALWNKYRAAVITFNQALLARLDAAKASCPDENFETPDIMELRYQATLAIQVMVHDIFASIPFSLGDVPSYNYYNTTCPSKSTASTGLPKSVGGYFLVWSLTVILRCSVASGEQRNTARAALVRIGRQFGISYAVKSAQNYMGTAENACPADSNTEPLPMTSIPRS
jgi:hypothetical protein